MYDGARRGLDLLAQFVGFSRRTIERRFKEDMKKRGVLLERFVGRPPRRTYLWFPEVVM